MTPRPIVQTLQTLANLLKEVRYQAGLAALWLVVLGIFLWINRLNLLAYILGRSDLSLGEKLIFLINVYTNFFASLSSPLALSMMIFAFITAINLLLLIVLMRAGGKLRHGARTNAAAAAAAAGSHILSCGGLLLLAPLIPAVGGAGNSVLGAGTVVNQSFGIAANLLGSLIILYSITQIAQPVSVLKRKEFNA